MQRGRVYACNGAEVSSNIRTFLQKFISLRTSAMATSCGVVTMTAPCTPAASFKYCREGGEVYDSATETNTKPITS